MEFLKEGALQFLEMSKAAAERGFYKLALFHAEQALQLYNRKLGDFLRRRSAVLALLEHAYITSRCLPFRARREDYEVVRDALGEALDVLRCLESL